MLPRNHLCQLAAGQTVDDRCGEPSHKGPERIGPRDAHAGKRIEAQQAGAEPGHPFLDALPLMTVVQGETVEEIVRDAAHRLVGNLERRKDFLNLMFIEMVEFDGQHVPQIFQIIFPDIMAFAQRFVAKGDELRPIPLLVVVRAFVGLFFSFLITDILIADQLPPDMRENALDYFVDIYLNGILKQGAPAEEAQ